MSDTMQKTIFITGSTDGIGLEAAKTLAAKGHRVLVHGRNADKLARAHAAVADVATAGPEAIDAFQADLSDLSQVEALAREVAEKHPELDVLINNAGVFRTPKVETGAGLDVRFVVNTIAPYLLTKRLLPRLAAHGRVLNLSSAAQAPVDLEALVGSPRLDDGPAYAQSKLGITMWSRRLAQDLGPEGPVVVAINPGSMLATKMVKEAFGVAGADIRIGADILVRAALDDSFAKASGQYWDNDNRRFAPPQADGLDDAKADAVVRAIEGVIAGG